MNTKRSAAVARSAAPSLPADSSTGSMPHTLPVLGRIFSKEAEFQIPSSLSRAAEVADALHHCDALDLLARHRRKMLDHRRSGEERSHLGTPLREGRRAPK